MIAAGLTGGIGSGKTVVAQMFSVLGIPVFYADSEAKKLYADKNILALLRKEFGGGIFRAGTPDLKALASIVFSDAEALRKLNAILHPPVLAAYREWLTSQGSAPYTVMESALIFESGLETMFDKVIAVYAEEDLCIQRVALRDGISAEDIRQRMQMQMSPELKAERADFVMQNNEVQPLIPQVLDVHRRLSKQS